MQSLRMSGRRQSERLQTFKTARCWNLGLQDRRRDPPARFYSSPDLNQSPDFTARGRNEGPQLGFNEVIRHHEFTRQLQTKGSPMIALNALVGRCMTFFQRANGANAFLQQNFPESYSLDPSHVPHLTLWQNFHSGDPAGISNVAKKPPIADSNTTSI
jgi:hypothetical protein